MSGNSADGIQALLAAETEAQRIVTAARAGSPHAWLLQGPSASTASAVGVLPQRLRHAPHVYSA
jgi:hypothetical protein